MRQRIIFRDNFHRKSGAAIPLSEELGLVAVFSLSNELSFFGGFACREGISKRFSEGPLLHASLFQNVMYGCNRSSIEDLHKIDHNSFRIEDRI
jgi:hypothetical protein